MASSLERAFRYWYALLADDLPEPATEYRFDARRRWRFDCAWPDLLCAVELHGGMWSGGAHVRPRGVQRDLEKHNAATLLGWRVLYFSTDDLNTDPERCIGQVRALLEAA
jgi:very-short-patch-repair endonuclease